MNWRVKSTEVCKTSNYTEPFLVLASAITGCISISAFEALICVPIGITSSTIGLKMYAIIPRIKKCIRKRN